MLHSMARVPGIALRVCLEVLGRLQQHGARSAAVCTGVHLYNASLRARNRLHRLNRVGCPCCGWTGAGFRALDCGRFVVREVECPNCGAHERHRFLHLFLTRRPPAFMLRASRVLHFAPEASVRHFIDQNPDALCFSTDYAKGIYRGILQGVAGPCFISDIHHLPLTEGSVDGIFCLHVLEHVADDREAIRNLYRISRVGGEAVLMVPFMMGQTETEEYGQPDPELFDHVRGYSPLDFKHRLAPFSFEEIVPSVMLRPEEVDRYKIPDSQVIYRCWKGDRPNG